MKADLEVPPLQHHQTNLGLDSGLFERMAVALENQGVTDPTGELDVPILLLRVLTYEGAQFLCSLRQ